METLKGIKLDINRIILQLLIPGIFSATPFYLLFINSFDGAKEYLLKSDGICTTVLFIISLTMGLILEDFGAWVESGIDSCNKKKYKTKEESYRDTDQEWDDYLKLEIQNENEIVAQRYLRTILIRMKFELSFFISLLVMILGLFFLNLKITFLDSWIKFILICVILPLAIALYLLIEARDSSRLMIKTRKLILDKFSAEPGSSHNSLSS